MGKKSRLKRKRKHRKKRIKEWALSDSLHVQANQQFLLTIHQLRGILIRHRAEDVIVATTVSELWLPNITSQVKHQLLLRIAVSVPSAEYLGTRPLDSYEDFQEFLRDVYSALPSFPTLEDYAPERDWGEVRLDVRNVFIPIMYGGSVERITDFVTAFRMAQRGNAQAAQDMDFALWMQSYLIQNIQAQSSSRTRDDPLGHLEIPPQGFWEECRTALRSAGVAAAQALGECSKDLCIEPGSLRMPDSRDSFGNSILDGSLLPALMVRTNGISLPLSPRSAAGVVVDKWANRMIGTKDEQLIGASFAISDFLGDRFRPNDIITGPFEPGTSEELMPYVLAGAFVAGDKLYVVAPGHFGNPSSIVRMCRDVRDLIASGGKGKWGFKYFAKGKAVQVLRGDDEPFSMEDVNFLVIGVEVTTQMSSLPDVGRRARLIALSDFVSVFDSLRSLAEFGEFLSYVDKNSELVWSPFAGFTDLFGSFRDSHGLLVDGAVQPTMIGLDPHWGSNWRFERLLEFWKSSPPDFPDDRMTWVVDSRNSDNLYQMISKGRLVLSWSTVIGRCTVHVVFPFVPDDVDATNGNLLETFVHCAADSLSQRQDIIAALPIFRRPRIVILCRPEYSTLVAGDVRTVNSGALAKPLLMSAKLVNTDINDRILLGVKVNMSRAQVGFHGAVDASFETECAAELLRCVAALTDMEIDDEIISHIASTSRRLPRFTLQQMARDVDVPDHVSAILPEPADYKIARRDLAVVFRDIHAEPGRYELVEAKELIDRARDAYRAEIHRRIGLCDLNALLLFCVEQHDALATEFQRTTTRVQISLAHEVNFSRAESIATALTRFTNNARNYRYIIEAALSQVAGGDANGDARISVGLVAAVDWLFVLYGASDVLHNAVHPGGVVLDQHYVPEVFFSEDHDEREHEFAIEQANLKLGVEVTTKDEVHGPDDGRSLAEIDQSFDIDLGFSLSQLAQCLTILSRWPSATGSKDLKLSYRAPLDEIVNVLCKTIEGLTGDVSRRIVGFLTIEPEGIRQLLGKDFPELDVPVWEHNKRTQRLTIRPLIPLGTGDLVWGAAAAERALSIWSGSIFSGYLPADFDWPTVKAEVRKIKKGIEKELERRAHEICGRATPHVAPNVNFMHRFKKEGFEDVGDFDVLAYWPDSNRWVAIECKYNQPPFCLKDARRLRDLMFGTGSDHGQFEKIERRHRFLDQHLSRLRELLRWPVPTTDQPASIEDVYVGREIYWWMRNPPYEVVAHFVRIDTLEGWLRKEGLLKQ